MWMRVSSDERLAVRLDGVTVDYPTTTALAAIDLTVRAGERVALVGPSGAGKSTLLGLCNGTVYPTAGRVGLLGRDTRELSPKELRQLRAQIATVHQRLHLVGPLRVVHNVNGGRLGSWSSARALASLLRPKGTQEVRQALAKMGVDHKMYERTDRLSGGEQQRVALSRVLVQEPRLVLADEPVSSLDPERAREVMGLLTTVTKRNSALVVSLHAFDLAREFCDRVVGLRDGRIVFDLPRGAVDDSLATSLYRISNS